MKAKLEVNKIGRLPELRWVVRPSKTRFVFPVSGVHCCSSGMSRLADLCALPVLDNVDNRYSAVFWHHIAD